MQTKPKTDPQGGKLRTWGDNRVTRSFTAGELLDKKFPRRALLLPFLRQSEAALIYGKSGAGKSWFLLALALCIVGEGDVFGWKPEACPQRNGWRVELFDGEMHPEDISQRVAALQENLHLAHPERIRTNLAITPQQVCRDVPYLTTPGAFAAYYANRLRPHVIVIDSLSFFSEVRSELDPAAFNGVNQTVKALKGAGFAVLMGHHTGKSKASSYRGPSSIIMPYDSALKLTPVDAPEDPEGVTPATVMVRCEKARAGRWIKPFEAQLVRAFPTGRQWVSDVVSPALSKMQALLAVSTSKADLARRAGWDRSYVTKLEQQGVELGLFDRDEVAATLKGNKRGQAQGIEGETSDF